MSEETKSEVVSGPAKRVPPAKRAETFAQDVAMWTEKAPLCKCKLEKVIYICQDQMCHKGDESRFMYCNLCLEKGEHQHFTHVRITNAMKTFSQRFETLKENSVTMYDNATNFISEFLPLIRYLDKLSVEVEGGMLARFPVKRMISEGYQSLNSLKIKVTNITDDIENLIESGEALSLIKINMGFEGMSDQLTALTYLSGLSEDFLYKNYGAALRDNSNTSSFEGFTQPCRDSFMRLKFRTMADGAQQSSSVNVKYDPQNIDNVETDSWFTAIEQKIALSSSNTSGFEKSQGAFNRKIQEQVEAMNLRLDSLQKQLSAVPTNLEANFKSQLEPINKDIKSLLKSVESFNEFKVLATKNFMQMFERARNCDQHVEPGKDKWNAAIFEAKKDIRLYAIAIQGPNDNKPRDFTIGYKYIIQDSPDGKELSKSANVITEEVKCPPANYWSEYKHFKYDLKEKSGILVKAGQCLNFAYWIQHQPGSESHLYASSEVDAENDDLKSHISKLDTQSTDQQSGQLPCVYYTLE